LQKLYTQHSLSGTKPDEENPNEKIVKRELRKI